MDLLFTLILIVFIFIFFMYGYSYLYIYFIVVSIVKRLVWILVYVTLAETLFHS